MNHRIAPAPKECLQLSHVYITDAVVQSCFAHAFTTEREEVMGVLLGDVAKADATPETPLRAEARDQGSSDGGCAKCKVAFVWGSYIMQRSVRTSDRVEVAPEMLVLATEEAERVSAAVGRRTRVIGWYHSHPHITPYPSAVDLQCQRSYQNLESGWVGLIFSVFHADSSQRNDCAIHCFQAGDPCNVHLKVPLEVVSSVNMGLELSVQPRCEAMLETFNSELATAVEKVRERSAGDVMAVGAARGLQQAQLFTLERVIAEPMVKYLEWCSLPVLQEEVRRLEHELEALKEIKK